MRTETEHTIRLMDYEEPAYRIVSVYLDFAIEPETSRVRAQLTIEPAPGTGPGTPLVLDGEALKLEEIAIDGAPLVLSAYAADETGLTVVSPPNRRFVLETLVAVAPETNTRLMGLYRSNSVWCTQCEPEGFRRITYYLDRPDVLAPFTVRMTASRELAPVLLSNGNPVSRGDAGDGRHYAVWEDPFPKPSYLFALVAGDLGAITDSYTTGSGRKVDLAIYCEHGNEARCEWAMDSLKRSMAWDEKRFGREYDLDVFNIVAVSDFNFGAMENKGLNIFNDRLVFADPETATDANYESIERVIAHEYFHNWTGNRITCRDWFQLCLKEGLTVYRDQEFTADERSRAVKRISDVVTLRATQFPEDAGPLAHAPRPDTYREINNFYTATVYEKGAEVVRMLATLLGEARFKAGMDLYFERHDGEASTVEAFVRCFEEAGGLRFGEGFLDWYTQAGTPRVTVSEDWDEANKTYSLTLTQRTEPTPGQPEKRALPMPVRFGLIGPNGSPMGYRSAKGIALEGEDMMVISEQTQTVTFEGLSAKPVPSLFRGFSAPVNLELALDREQRLFLARHDADPFNRWQAGQDVALELAIGAVRSGTLDEAAASALGEALVETLEEAGLDDAFKALALTLPDEAAIARAIGADVDPLAVHEARERLVGAVFGVHGDLVKARYEALGDDAPYAPTTAQAGRRALRNRLLKLLVASDPRGPALAARQYEGAANMTDRFEALAAIGAAWTEEAPALLADFRLKHANDPLVFDKWLAVSARATDDGVIERIRAILADPAFPQNNPNRLRSLVGTFALQNPVQFTRADGEGFRFVAGFVADVDQRNPQVAARVLTGFRIWPMLEPERREKARAALAELGEHEGLSRNTADILGRMLAG